MRKDELACTFPICDWNPLVLDNSSIANATLAHLNLEDAIDKLGLILRRYPRAVSAVQSVAAGKIPEDVPDQYWGRADLAMLNTTHEEYDTGKPYELLRRGENATYTGSFPYLCYHRNISSLRRQNAAKILIGNIRAEGIGIKGTRRTKAALKMDAERVAGFALGIVNVLAVTIVNWDFVKTMSGDNLAVEVGKTSHGVSSNFEQPGSGWLENEKGVRDALVNVASTHLYPIAVTAHLIAQRLHVINSLLGSDRELLNALRYHSDKEDIHIRRDLRSLDKRKNSQG